jgi:catechol 2,3-dioxygenase-like lactoylglutathione lyase family enzyme
MEMKIELIPVPVRDAERAKKFYVEQVGFHADHDYQVNENLRFVQLTPSESACSIVIGEGTTEMIPGSQEIQMVVRDASAARDELAGRGVDVSDIEVMPWGTFIYFRDPDGNKWSLQQVPDRQTTD